MPLTQYYHVRDPMENLLISVTLRKVDSTHLIPPDLARRPRDKRNESVWTPNQHRAWLRANREDKFRAMHIVALIEGKERVLCSLRFYKESGLFCATPGFSAPIIEPENDPDLLIKGPKLTTYHVSTPSGSLYEYVLDNAHDLLPFASTEDQWLSREIRLQEEKRDTAEVTRWQQLDKPRFTTSNTMQRKLMLSLEVVAADNPQTADPVTVEYELELPDRAGCSKWKLLSGNQSQTRGKTSLSLPQRSQYPDCVSSAAFGSHQHFSLKLVKAEHSLEAGNDHDFGGIVAAPVLHLSVFSRDSWRRKRTEGHGEIKLPASSGLHDFDVPIRKPIVSIQERMEELFLGIDESDIDQGWPGERTRDREVGADDSPISTMITSRLGQKSEATGTTVRIRCNIVDIRPATRAGGNNSASLTPAVIATPLANTRVVKRSVQEILQSVKLEKRIASITDPRIQVALRSLQSSQSALV
ncbi:hypothetical protein PHYSODRAFT_310132 [Phytophthora sojae]|uniref:Uncharacterized protein n=1 Tax=Phytophthora sojae (strain P6497) TaxID=1094619 RepID=G4YNA1_PHYSP|nr:hypothetical protein PHYSODRAFT_310132 [Phytophthora sojae]EGZ30054.1 hypothetical protein PHYSODRAFT_310132 [Phytophthora sojae]|eukprot:XP_009517329.1 hypothetical protein PHYSODRAFT_310132 [Phytophthora sojae]